MPERNLLSRDIHPSLFNRAPDLENADLKLKVFQCSQLGNPDPKNQRKTSILSLLHDEQTLFRDDVSLQLRQDGHISNHPQNLVTAFLIVGIDDPFTSEIFNIQFKLPEDIPFPDWKDIADNRLTQFLIQNLVNPVQRFLQNIAS
jgi:hypothetical protein